MKADLLEREFARCAVSDRPRPLMLEPADALALIARATEEGVPIRAIDGVRVRDGRADAPREQRADFSGAVAEGHGCWEDADAFIRARRDLGLAFTLTLGTDPIEAV